MLLLRTRVTLTAPAAPPAPAPAVPAGAIAHLTTLNRRAGTTGPLTTGTALPPAVVAAVAAAGYDLLAGLRLIREDTGVEIPITAPTRLVSDGSVVALAYAAPAANLVGLTSAAPIPTRLQWDGTVPAARIVAAIPFATVPEVSNWSRTAADRCAGNLMGLPLTPKASRGTLASWS